MIIKILCCYNTIEDKALKENCVRFFEGIKFEFKSSGTSQINGVVECGYDTIYSWMHYMMEHVGIYEKSVLAYDLNAWQPQPNLKNYGKPTRRKMLT